LVFSSVTFLFIFLPIVFGVNLLFKNIQVKNIVLIIFSLLFYAWGEPIYVFLMIASTIANYFLALFISRSTGKGKKAFLVLTIIFNIGLLVIFKYTNFLVDTFNSLTGLSLAVAKIAMPIGISFFTFQAMSYVLDVYMGKISAQKNYLNIVLYISLFPQLIAGPIVKYHDIEEQLTKREMTIEKTALGIRRFSIGLAKKVLVANVLGMVADKVYALNAGELNVLIAWAGAIAYMLQIYFDFSGYSDMAIGLGKMFGFNFLENFNYPYISKNIKEFWRRWHISLSTWFKEYVYIPMGGNRRGKLRTNVNKITVFFLTGLWHGANWTFVVWGLYNGLFLLLEDINAFKKRKFPAGLSRIYALLVVVVGFVIFRSDTLNGAMIMLKNMFLGFNFTSESASLLSTIISPMTIFVFIAAIIASTPICGYIKERIKGRWANALSYALSLMLFGLSVLYLSMSAYNPFIYFRF